MDRILLIDAHNAMWRANTVFGNGASLHKVEAEGSTIASRVCICGADWNYETKSCTKDYVMVFNFFRNLRPLIENADPHKCFFVLEGHPQFRYDLFADYKANRIVKQAAKKETYAKFQHDSAIIISLMKHLPITLCRASSYEADDTIAALCENMKEEEVTVISNDSDYIQLLQRGYKHLTIYNPIKKETMVAPTYPYVAWKCLSGDKSDNIPALLKPKKALDCVANPELFKKFMEVEENRANFNVNRQLIEFHTVPEDEISLVEGVANFDLLKEEFTKMEFQSIVNDNSWNKYKKTFDCLKF